MHSSRQPLKKEYKLALAIIIITGIISIIAASFAIYKATKLGTKTNQIVTGTLILVLNDSTSTAINLTAAVPVTDSTGLTTTPYTFTLQNTGSNNSQYRIKLIEDETTYSSDGCTNNRLAWTNIKYSLSKNGATDIIGLLSDNSGIIDTGVINTGITNTYTLRLWVKDTATNEIMGQHFHGKIEVDAILAGKTNYTTGG